MPLCTEAYHVLRNVRARRRVQEAAIGQLLSLGFDSTAARAALEACGWSVEAAANRLLS